MANRRVRSTTRTMVKKAELALQSNDSEQDVSTVANATKALDRAGSKGVLPRNTVARGKSRLARLLNKSAAAS